MKRFTGETSNGIYEVVLIDNSIALVYIESGFGGGWQAQKTEFRLPVPGFFSIEDSMFGGIGPLEEDEDEPVSCRVTEGEDGESELTVTLTNDLTRRSAEWTFTADRVYGPLFTDGWGAVLRDILDGMETE